MRVIGHHERQRQLGGQPQQALPGPPFDLQAVVHDLDEEVARAENVPVGRRCFESLAVLAEPEPGLHLAARAAGGRDDAPGVRGEQLAVHPRLTEVPFKGGQRGEPEQIVHALGGLGEQGHVGVGAGARDVVVLLCRGAPAHRLLVPPVLGSDVCLCPDDRLDAGRPRLDPEVVGAVDVAMICHRDRRHAGAVAFGEDVRQPGCTVQHRVLGVDVQVHERAVAARCRDSRRGCRHEVPPPSGMRPHARLCLLACATACGTWTGASVNWSPGEVADAASGWAAGGTGGPAGNRAGPVSVDPIALARGAGTPTLRRPGPRRR